MARAALAAGALALAAAAAAQGAGAPCRAAAPEWPLWSRYVRAFVSEDGRVIDRTARDRTTSEGQAYALFFSLVADDPGLFQRLLRWTADNLAGGKLPERLPAWAWGQRRDGGWGILDPNSASDADLWMAYALLEAGRLWAEPRYDALGRGLLARIAEREVARLPALGPTLLPGPRGFALDRGRGWRLNPSYLPPQLLRRAAAAAPRGPWRAVLASALRLVPESAPRGVVPDWALYRPGAGLLADPVKGRTGSYDAIRAYLWIGLLPPGDPDRRALATATAGLLRILAERGALPERVDAGSLRGQGAAPPGFYAALLPLAATERPALRPELEARLASALRDGLYGTPPAYYDQNLALFGQGFAEGRYAFDAEGRLAPAWGWPCAGPR
ncbi:cellulose synthase complex periplasmic endoglucanase BcsZ [Anaeromyxobacter paludicola]|uniref:Glucanase n=1 Tax=Anaeromyxobacter paludicola TaxID=2918171 RepID=A0ABM7X946_9BACT|nr:cellulose synthase complex periplasmic endoglucanase BcsZ [Anaeromyxobacter paludicola]BDG08352.1 glucanase [Anaeromyxobacter paludicola]